MIVRPPYETSPPGTAGAFASEPREEEDEEDKEMRRDVCCDVGVVLQ